MNIKQLLLGTLVVGLVANICDMVFYGFLLSPVLKGIEGMNQDEGMLKWFIIGDFVFVFMVTWYYGIVRGSFSSGLKFGVITGFFLSFPMQLFWGMMMKGHPYWLSWVNVVYGVLWGAIVGWVLGMLFKPKAA